MFKGVYTTEELMKAESDMQEIAVNKFLKFASDSDNRDCLTREYKTSNPERIKHLVMIAAEYAGGGMTPEMVDWEAFDPRCTGIKFSIEDILSYIDNPSDFQADYKIELNPHTLSFENLNENSVREYAEREYIKHIMKKYREIPGYDFKTAVEDMTELMKTA